MHQSTKQNLIITHVCLFVCLTIDDCKNIAKILGAIARQGYKYAVTGKYDQSNQSSGQRVSRGSRHGRGVYNDSNTLTVE